MENNNIEYDAAIRATDTSAGMISFVPEGEKEKKKRKKKNREDRTGTSSLSNIQSPPPPLQRDVIDGHVQEIEQQS